MTDKLWKDLTPEEKRKILEAFKRGERVEWSYRLPFKLAHHSHEGGFKPCWTGRACYRIAGTTLSEGPSKDLVSEWLFTGLGDKKPFVLKLDSNVDDFWASMEDLLKEAFEEGYKAGYEQALGDKS